MKTLPLVTPHIGAPRPVRHSTYLPSALMYCARWLAVLRTAVTINTPPGFREPTYPRGEPSDVGGTDRVRHKRVGFSVRSTEYFVEKPDSLRGVCSVTATSLYAPWMSSKFVVY